jgi:hypothetical protein
MQSNKEGDAAPTDETDRLISSDWSDRADGHRVDDYYGVPPYGS